MAQGKNHEHHQIDTERAFKYENENVTVAIKKCKSNGHWCFAAYTEDGDEFLQVDLNEIMEKIIPTCTTEGMYHYPGPLHAKFAEEEMHDDKTRCLNTDAHLRATLVGNSVTLPVIDTEVVTGKFGYIYFVDWDRKVERERSIYIQVLGE